MYLDLEHLETRPSGSVLTPEDWNALEQSSCDWYDEEITKQGKQALKKRLNEYGVRGEKATMAHLRMSRSQVQSLVGPSAQPPRENLESALQRIGPPLHSTIDVAKKRETMIEHTVKRFRSARHSQSEHESKKSLSATECDRVTRDIGLPQFQSFFVPDKWLSLIDGLQRSHQLSQSDAIIVADWSFGRMCLDGFRRHIMTAISQKGAIEEVDLSAPQRDSAATKVSLIMHLYYGFKDAPDRIEVARRTHLPKKNSSKTLDELIEFCGLKASDFEPNTSSIPLLLLKSEGTAGYVSNCLKEMNSRRGGN